MKRRIIKILALISVLFTSLAVYGQGFSLYLPLLWNSYYNPAYTAIDGHHQVNSGGQLNYYDMPHDMYNGFVSADVALGNKVTGGYISGFGLYAITDNVGDGTSNLMYQVNQFGGRVAAGVNLGKQTEFNVGLSSSIRTVNINPGMLVFGDQLDPYLGKVTGGSMILSDDLMEQKPVATVGFGFNLRHDFNRNYNQWYNTQVLDLGFAISNLGTSQLPESTSNDIFGVTSEYNILVDAKYYSQLFLVNPNVVIPVTTYLHYEQRASMKNAQVGAIGNLHGIVAGFSLRFDQYDIGKVNTSVFHLGYVPPSNSWAFNYSVGIPRSDKGLAFNSNSHEFILTFTLERKNKNGNFRNSKNRQNYRKRTTPCLQNISDRPKEICPSCDNNWLNQSNLKKSNANR